MKFAVVAGLAGLGAARAALLRQAASPVGKVVQLLGDLQGKILKEGEEAHKVYAEFSEWCEERSKNVGYEIKTGKSEVEELKATIGAATSDIGALSSKVDTLSGEIAVDQSDLKAAQGIRAQEASAFAATEKELTEVVDTLQRAVGLLEREMKKGSSLAQVQSAGSVAQALAALVQASMLSTADASRLTALVQSSAEDGDALGAPAAAVYQSSSGGIVDTLQDLLEKSQEQLDAARKKETGDTHNFEMLLQSLKDEIKFAEKEFAEAKKGIAAAGEKKSVAEGDLAATSKDLAADEATLKTLHGDCMTKAEDFEAEVKSRSEELTALAKAKAVLQDSTGAAADLSYGLAQTSFLQLSARISSSAGLAQFEAMRIIRDLARKEHSASLTQLAARMGTALRVADSSKDPFAKVKGLIQDMLEKLEAAAEQDATKKAFCDKELAESNEKKADKTAEIDKLSTQIDSMSARSAQLKEETAALQKALSDLASAQAEMDKIRAEEKEIFVKNKADLEEGLKGVKLALKILGEYYAKEDKSHAAAEGAGSGIIGMLEVVESDFTKGLAEATATEENSASEYDAGTKANSIEKATKEQDVKYKVKESTELDKTVAETSSDRSSVQAELDAVLEYLSKIEEQCIAKAESYESRKARYEAELAGLKQALQVLSSETALLQRGSAARRLRASRQTVL